MEPPKNSMVLSILTRISGETKAGGGRDAVGGGPWGESSREDEGGREVGRETGSGGARGTNGGSFRCSPSCPEKAALVSFLGLLQVRAAGR